jgi:hypothetical protein
MIPVACPGTAPLPRPAYYCDLHASNQELPQLLHVPGGDTQSHSARSQGKRVATRPSLRPVTA